MKNRHLLASMLAATNAFDISRSAIKRQVAKEPIGELDEHAAWNREVERKKQAKKGRKQ